jgi:hypothetical protein
VTELLLRLSHFVPLLPPLDALLCIALLHAENVTAATLCRMRPFLCGWIGRNDAVNVPRCGGRVIRLVLDCGIREARELDEEKGLVACEAPDSEGIRAPAT